jgi:hypothetical protein
MSCLPQSSGCERPFTDIFVGHLNRVDGTQYMHRACLDVIERTVPQPEALYMDNQNGRKLVVERKTISWPSEYAHRHSNDHAVAEIFSSELNDLAVDDLYEVRLPLLIEGKRAELVALAREATKQICANWSVISSGRGLKGRSGDNWWWHIQTVPKWDRDEDAASESGLRIFWEGPGLSLDDYLDASVLPEKLSADIQKIYSACTAKFAFYSDSRRILLLHPYGDSELKDADWWKEVWAGLPPAPEIDKGLASTQLPE